ncbi:tRNAHis guanylyltransferase-domain-containing protein [Camillea tinctor]|nr:tRNAHis guanylyltransferase-domain-containing protein [Camillea tinctor]
MVHNTFYRLNVFILNTAHRSRYPKTPVRYYATTLNQKNTTNSTATTTTTTPNPRSMASGGKGGERGSDDPPATTPTPTKQKLTLGDRMKQYEAALDITLPSSSAAILRLDGHGFSRFTASFQRPFDPRIHAAMLGASGDLLGFFPRATVAYTQSDEITLVFPPAPDDSGDAVGAFNSRVQKLVSLAASYCSVRFNAHLAVPGSEIAHFDARVFAVPSADEALNCLLWRCRGDAVRNSIGAFARTLFTPREMLGRTSAELVEMMRAQKGVVYEEAVPRWAVEGCLVKRERYRHEGFNPKTGRMEATTRTRIRVEERGVKEFSAENIRLITDKYWPGDGDGDEG